MENAVEERTGVDEALVWRLYRTDAISPEAILTAARALPEDALLLADYVDEAMEQALQEADFHCQYNPLDLAYLIAGPTQQDRAKRYRQEQYRIIGRPA